jgi:hypothetical protein
LSDKAILLSQKIPFVNIATKNIDTSGEKLRKEAL